MMKSLINYNVIKMIFTKSRKILFLFAVSFLPFSHALGQAPVWVVTTPSVGTVGPMTIPINYGIDRNGIIYICVYNYNNETVLTSVEVKNIAIGGPSGNLVATAVLPVTLGNINMVMTQVMDVVDMNRLHTIFIVAEGVPGVIQAVPVKTLATTLPCTKIDLLTGFTQPVQCINRGVTATFHVVTIDSANSGVLKGTQWILDWGDGATSSFVSSSDFELPPLALRTHTYTSVTNCNYVFSNTISNPCGETRTVQYVAIVHGRDIPTDGDGLLRIVDNSTGSSVIQVCEGSQSVITLRDNSTWDCQNPVLPGGLTPVPNTDPRNIEWLYGRDPSGTIFNTITGPINISMLGSAPRTSGRISPVPYGSSSLSQAITIPATARAGEYFRVYLKNWNKCNWADPEFVSTYIDIQVVPSPPPPTVSNKSICFGDDRTLSVTSAPIGTISWYADAALTTVVGTGPTFLPSQTAAGSYTFWVTDRSLIGTLCQSSPTAVTLIINPIPSKPTLSHPVNDNLCYDGGFTTYTITAVASTPPAVTSFQWYRNGVVIPGETNSSIVLSQQGHSGSYTVSTVGAAPSFCISPQSDPWNVTVRTLSDISNPVPVSVCQGQIASFSAFTSDLIQNWQWEASADGGINFTTIGAAPPYSGFNTNTLTITNPPSSFNGYLYRVELKTPPGEGGCAFKSNSARLTVDAPFVNAGHDQGICALANATLSGTIGGGATTAIWSGGTGTFSPDNTTLNAIYTPSASERAAHTVTLTLTTNDPAGTCTSVSDNVTISIGTIPLSATLTSSGDACFGAAPSWLRIDIIGGAEPYLVKHTVNGVPRPDIVNYISGTIYNLGILPQGTYTYTITEIRDNCGNILTGSGLLGPGQSSAITINSLPTLLSSLTIPDICSNTIINYIPTSATPGTTFLWTRAVVAGITPAGPASGSGDPSETLRNFTGMPIDVTYQYILTSNGCINYQNVTVRIKPEPIITSGQTINISSDFPLNYHVNLANFINPADNVTFTWPVPFLNPISPDFTGGTARSAPSANNISDIFVNKTGLPGTAFYTVIPSKDGCAGAPEPIAVFVSSEPVLDPGLNRTVCGNSLTGLILRDAPGSVNADYYNVLNVTLDPGLSSNPGNAPVPNMAAPANYLSNDRYTNNTGVEKNVIYTVQPVRAPDNFGDPVNIIITIHPQPAIIPGQHMSVCSGRPIDKEILLSPANIPTGTMFSWNSPIMSDASVQGTNGINVAADPAGKIHINDIIVNASGVPITATYNITPLSSHGCLGTTIPVVIIVNPEPVPKPISGRDRICAGEVNLVYNTVPAPGSIFHWTVDPMIGTKVFDYNTNAIIINASSTGGSGNITMYETNSYTCTGIPSLLAVQTSPISVPENISGPTEICAFSTQVYGVTFHPGSVYNWSIPGGASITGYPSASSITIVFGSTGGTITVSEINPAGCITIHNPMTVAVRPLPTATISGQGTICESNSLGLNIDFTGSGPYIFTYAINGVTQVPISTPSDPYTLNATQEGTYTIVSVSDAIGCSNTGYESAPVSHFPTPTGVIAGGTEICTDSSTVISMVFTGTSPFTFTYSDGTTPFTVPNYPNSVYTVNVSPDVTSTYSLLSLTDANGCTGTLSGSAVVTVNLPPTLNLYGTNLSCNNLNTGAIDLTATGNGPLSFSWFGPDGFISNTEDISGLRAGYYNVSVRDTKGCFSGGSVTLTESAALSATITSSVITCNGAADGTISISEPTGGSGVYEYSINGGASWQRSGSFTGLIPGTYNVQIRDGSYPVCIRILNNGLVITEPSVLSATLVKSDITCFGAADGSISISNSLGGQGSYQYSINGGIVWNPSNTFTGLEPGVYDVRIRDAASPTCIIILNPSMVLTQPAGLDATFQSTNVTCFGANDGTILVTLPSGGHGTYQYSLNGGTSWQGSPAFTNLSPGIYDVRLRDAVHTQCSRILNPGLVLTEPVTLAISSTGDIVLDCFGDNNGTGTFNVSGGTMPYNFAVISNTAGGTFASPGFNSMNFFNAGPGSVTVSVTDLNGCGMQANINITQHGNLDPGIISGNQVVCSGDTPSTIAEITPPTGGAGSYAYQWQSAANIEGPYINIPLAISSTYTPPASASSTFYYRRSITSGVCPPVYSNAVEIRGNPLPSAVLSGGETICTGQSSVLRINMPSGTGPFTIDIENHGTVTGYVSGSEIFVTPLITTTYRLLRVSDANNCEVLAPSANLGGTATVIVNKLPSITSFVPSPAVCESTQARFDATADGTNLSFQWYVNDGSGFNPLSDGVIYLGTHTSSLQILNTVRSMNGNYYRVVVSGCGNSVTSPDAVLTVNTPPEIIQVPRDTTVCVGQNAIMQVNATGTSIVWQWSINKGAGFIPLVDDASFSGSTNKILTITNSQAYFNNWLFRATASGGCGEPVKTSFAVLKIVGPPSATAGGAQTICFGDSATVSGAAYSNGIILWTSNGVGGLSGSHTLTPTYTPAFEETGKTITLTMTVTGTGGCNPQTAIATYSVFVKETQTISFGPLADKVYGDSPFILSADASSSLEVNFTSSDNSVVTISGKTATIAGAGTSIIYAKQPGDPNHCPAPQVYQTLKVAAKPIVVAADSLQSKIYGDDDPHLTYTVSPAMVGSDRLTGAPSRDRGENTGITYTINQGTLDAGSNYIMKFVPGSFTISVKHVTVTVNPEQNKIYGSSDPALKVSISPSLVTGDTILGSLVRLAGENAGYYPIQQGTLSLGSNYSTSFVPADFIIKKAPLFVTGDKKERRYLEGNPAFTFSYSGFVKGEDKSVLDVLPSLAALPDSTADSGEYTITISGGSDDNYSFVYVHGILTILKADQVITSFNELPKFLRTTQEWMLEATASSGLEVRFESSDENKAVISGNTMTVVKEGAVEIIAKQDGNQNWNPAPDVSQTVIGQPTFDNVTSLFTPNSDGMNDRWHIVDLEEFGSVDVKVFNRFGKLVYESSDYKNDWRGDFNGRPLPAASYYYIIKSSKKGIIRGVVNIIR